MRRSSSQFFFVQLFFYEGGLASSWDPLYADSSDCCKRLWWLDKDEDCTDQNKLFEVCSKGAHTVIVVQTLLFVLKLGILQSLEFDITYWTLDHNALCLTQCTEYSLGLYKRHHNRTLYLNLTLVHPINTNISSVSRFTRYQRQE